jgi:hypothetical protein
MFLHRVLLQHLKGGVYVIPEDAVATMYAFDKNGNIVLGLWHRSIHSSDMDWEIFRTRVDDPNDKVTSCSRHWREHDQFGGKKPPTIDKYP